MSSQTPAATTRFTSSVVVVNPDMARRMLERNLHNRPVSRISVDRYKADMLANRWHFAGDPIRFDTNNALLDGQHRLMALAECPPEVQLPFVVQGGLQPATQQVMDQGRKRTPGQQLALRGVKNYNMVAAGVKQYIVWRTNLMFRSSTLAVQVTSPQVEEWVEAHRQVVDELAEYSGLILRNAAPPSTAYCAAIAFHRIDPAASTEFYRQLAEGAEGGVGHPINALDKRLQRHRNQGLKISDRDLLALFVTAWNAWREQRELQKFQRPRGGSWTADTFPEPR